MCLLFILGVRRRRRGKQTYLIDRKDNHGWVKIRE